MAVKMKLGKSEKIKLVQRGRAALELGYVRNLVIIVDRYKVCLISRICLYLESQDYHNNTEMIYTGCPTIEFSLCFCYFDGFYSS